MTGYIIKTSSWYFKALPKEYFPYGISRGTPRYTAVAGIPMFKKLAPGPWFKTADVETYTRLYQAEILDKLDPHQVAAELVEMAGWRTPTLLCFERAGTGQWCHRAMVAGWLAAALGHPVPEVGYEGLPQDQHPLLPGFHEHSRVT